MYKINCETKEVKIEFTLTVQKGILKLRKYDIKSRLNTKLKEDIARYPKKKKVLNAIKHK